MLDDGLVQYLHVLLAALRFVPRPALGRGAIDDREVELRVIGAEPVEQFKGLVQHPVRARAVAVAFVDRDNCIKSLRERLLRHEARLRHRPIDRIDQQ